MDNRTFQQKMPYLPQSLSKIALSGGTESPAVVAYHWSIGGSMTSDTPVLLDLVNAIPDLRLVCDLLLRFLDLVRIPQEIAT